MATVRSNSSISVLAVLILNSLILSGSLLKPPSAKAGSNGCGSGWKSQLAANASGFAGVFRQACDAHDICYDTRGNSKPYCDNKFHKDMQNVCKSKYGTWNPVRPTCLSAAHVFWRSVASFGHNAYHEAQRN
jgi:hypothetical protein